MLDSEVSTQNHGVGLKVFQGLPGNSYLVPFWGVGVLKPCSIKPKLSQEINYVVALGNFYTTHPRGLDLQIFFSFGG